MLVVSVLWMLRKGDHKFEKSELVSVSQTERTPNQMVELPYENLISGIKI